MAELQTQFQDFIKRHGLIRPGGKVLLAVSGGIDSVVLFELFRQSKIPYAIAHCNFQLRGRESNKDEAFVRELAKKHGVRFYHTSFNTAGLARDKKLSIQEAARELRFGWLEKIRRENKYSHIATAHHLNDSIETFFINLLRGTGIKGLTGIPLVQGKIIRPLLFTGRTQISDFAKANKIKWREDSSNKEEDYLRNRIRHQLIPVLEKLNPQFSARMNENLEHLRIAEQFYDSYMEILMGQYVKAGRDGSRRITLEKLRRQENEEGILSAILHHLKFSHSSPQALLLQNSPGKIFHDRNQKLTRDRNELILESTAPEPNFKPIKITTRRKRIHDREQEIRLSLVNTPGSKLQLEASGIQMVDADLLKFPLLLRPWKPGDFFFPLGMKHRKKLSDFFVDQKLSLPEKKKCKVLLSGNDIVCILGGRIDDRFKVSGSTKKIYRIEIREK